MVDRLHRVHGGDGDSFKIGYRQSMYALGTDIAILWGGRTRAQAGDQRAGRQIRLSFRDVEIIRQECDLIAEATPELDRHLRISSPHNAGLFSIHGVAPVYQRIRSMEIGKGRPSTTTTTVNAARCACWVAGEKAVVREPKGGRCHRPNSDPVRRHRRTREEGSEQFVQRLRRRKGAGSVLHHGAASRIRDPQ